MKRHLFCTAVLSLVFGVSGFAQGFGTIGGTVMDPSGALIPGARVTVTEVGTGLPRSVTSDEQGRYVIPSLRPADYDLMGETPGFRAEEHGLVPIRMELWQGFVFLTLHQGPPSLLEQGFAGAMASQEARPHNFFTAPLGKGGPDGVLRSETRTTFS